MRAARNILHLGFKELRSLLRDPILMLLIAFALMLAVHDPHQPAKEATTLSSVLAGESMLVHDIPVVNGIVVSGIQLGGALEIAGSPLPFA